MKFLRRRADLIVAGLLSIMFAVEMALIDDVTGPRWLNVVAGIAVSAPLAFLRRSPFLVAVTVMSLATLQSAVLTPYFTASASFLGLMWLTYRAGELSGPKPDWKTLAVIIAGNSAVGSLYDDGGDFFVAAVAPVALWLAGRGVAQHNRLNRELARRADIAQRERDAQARLAAARERARIAGELQSIVIAEVRKIEDAAAVARHAGEDPRAAAHAFGEVAVIARRGLDQMRALLGVLREAREAPDPDPSDAPDPAEFARQRVRLKLWERTFGRLDERGQDLAVMVVWTPLLVLISQTNQFVDHGWESVLVTTLVAVGIFWRRRNPVAVVAVQIAIAGLAGLVFTAETRGVSILIAIFIPLYAAGRYRPGIADRLGVWLPIATAVAFTAINPIEVWSDLLFPPLFMLLAYAFGSMMASRSKLGEVLAEEARQVEAARDALAAAAVEDERLRIARDLHDVGAHSLSTIVLQAEAGKRTAERNPLAAARVAGTIATAARTALAEVEGLVRGAAPMTGLAGIDALVADARNRGLDVHVDIRTKELPAARDEVVYRVVQEALTNAAKHAGPTEVSVGISAIDGELLVYVRDAGPEQPAARVLAESGGGHGLAGMRERVELAGGWLSAGPSEDGGFVVEARLPIATAVPA